jgi:hypothetical protein
MRRLGPLIYRRKRDYRERANRISNAEAFLHRFVLLKQGDVGRDGK